MKIKKKKIGTTLLSDLVELALAINENKITNIKISYVIVSGIIPYI